MEYVHTNNEESEERIDVILSKEDKLKLASDGYVRYNGENGKVVIRTEEDSDDE